jgi:tRNA pseudouridine55 synthase
MDGLLVVHKPAGMSSFALLGQVKRRLGAKKAGYLGTLDPMATGVLVCFLGQATKLIRHFEALDKEYEVTFELGKVSDTYDCEGRVEVTGVDLSAVSETRIRDAIAEHQGDMWQIQPAFSAIRVAGKRAYDFARAGKSLNLGKRQVEIEDVEILRIDIPNVRCQMGVSSGTYVRSWVHELGQKLECGAVMTALQRTRVGPFTLDMAICTEDADVQNMLCTEDIRTKWLAHVK